MYWHLNWCASTGMTIFKKTGVFAKSFSTIDDPADFVRHVFGLPGISEVCMRRWKKVFTLTPKKPW